MDVLDVGFSGLQIMLTTMIEERKVGARDKDSIGRCTAPSVLNVGFVDELMHDHLPSFDSVLEPRGTQYTGSRKQTNNRNQTSLRQPTCLLLANTMYSLAQEQSKKEKLKLPAFIPLSGPCGRGACHL